MSSNTVNAQSMNGGSNGHAPNGHTNQTNNGEHTSNGMEFISQAVDLIIQKAVKEGTNPNSKVVEYVSPDDLSSRLDLSLPDQPVSNAKLLAQCRDIIKYSVRTGHPHFFNQLFGGLDPYTLMGSWMTEALNTSQYTYEVAPVFTLMEHSLFTEMRKMVGFQTGDGIFCPGGSISNMYAMNLARFKKFPDIKTKGMKNLPEMCVMTSDKGHYSLKKAGAVLGLGMDNIIGVKSDQAGRMCPFELDNALTKAKEQGKVPIMVNATSGSTVFGAFDPLEAIAHVCHKHGVWMHIDACWGGAVLFSRSLRHKMNGADKADSLAWNPHKMMGASLQAAVFLTKHENLLNECHSAKARYLFQQDKFYDVSYDTGDKSIQCGRKVDVLKVWLMWRARGSKGFESDMDHLFHCAQYLTHRVASSDSFRLVLKEPECTNVCFWYIPTRMRGQEETKEWWQELGKVAPAIKRRMVEQGTILIGYQPDGELVNFFRAVVSNSSATTQDMDFIVDEIDRLGHDL